MPIDSPTCFKQLQHLEQEGAVQPDLSSFGKKICIYGHTGLGIGVPIGVRSAWYLCICQLRIYEKGFCLGSRCITIQQMAGLSETLGLTFAANVKYLKVNTT